MTFSSASAVLCATSQRPTHHEKRDYYSVSLLYIVMYLNLWSHDNVTVIQTQKLRVKVHRWLWWSRVPISHTQKFFNVMQALTSWCFWMNWSFNNSLAVCEKHRQVSVQDKSQLQLLQGDVMQWSLSEDLQHFSISYSCKYKTYIFLWHGFSGSFLTGWLNTLIIPCVVW